MQMIVSNCSQHMVGLQGSRSNRGGCVTWRWARRPCVHQGRGATFGEASLLSDGVMYKGVGEQSGSRDPVQSEHLSDTFPDHCCTTASFYSTGALQSLIVGRWDM